MLESGRQALARGEWEEARRLFDGFLVREPGSAEALEGLGWALFWLDEIDPSFEMREAAYRRYQELGDARSAARVATAIALDAVDVRGFAVAAGWLERARRLLSAVALSPEHGWLALWEGHFARAAEHDLEKAGRLAKEARDIGAKLDLSDLELLAHALEGLVKVTGGDVRDGMRQLDEATAAAVSGDITELDSVAATCCFLVHACERVRDLDRAAQWGERIESLAARWRIGSVFTGCRVENAAVLIARGHWPEAEEELRSAMAAIRSTRPLTLAPATAQLGELRRRQGRTEEALELFGSAEPDTLAILGTAAIALERGNAVRCAGLAERLLRRPLAEKWVERAMALELLVRARVALAADPPDGPAAPLSELRAMAARIGTEVIRAIAKSAEAVVATADGDHSRARVLLEDAVDLFERCGAPWEAARTRVELASALRRLGREPFAREELAAAREGFRRLEAAVDAERAAALMEDMVPAPRSAHGSPLTRRETEVLHLVAQGMSDKEAASSLGLSEHTVHRHVANILAKLECPSRAAAATEAARRGWI